MEKVPVLAIDGKKKGEVTLPGVFSTPYRPDVILKAFQASRANRRQRYGAKPMAGAQHSTESAGKGKGMSRVPRIQGGSKGALAPSTVGGRRAHPPSALKNWSEKINDGERKLAIRSAIAATAQRALVTARGHKIESTIALPLVVEASFEKIRRTKEVLEALGMLGLSQDLARASTGRHVRAGRGKLRGRRVRTPTSLLIVAMNPEGLRLSAGNLPGVDIVTPEILNAERLAPGGTAGRLTVFTEDAIKWLGALK